MSYKVFANGNTLPASDLQINLMQQVIAVFTDATARDAAITSPVNGQYAHLSGSSTLTRYNGTAWADAIVGEGSLPTGGTTGQYLEKQSGTDYDADWVNFPSSSVSEQSTSRAITSADANNYIYATGLITITVDDALAIGEAINFIQNTAGAITFAAGAGVTLNSKDGLLNTNGQFTGASVTKKATNIYYLVGDLA
jgi:hypothetical protein